MVTTLTNRKHYLYVALLVILFIVAPVPFIVIAIPLLLYSHFTNRMPANTELRTGLTGINDKLLWIACILSLVTLGVYQTVGSVTDFGFPTTVVTYYHYTAAETTGVWRNLIARLSINPLQLVINILAYFLLLKLGREIWRAL